MTNELEAVGAIAVPPLTVRLGGTCTITVRYDDGTAQEYPCTLTPTELPDGDSN
jgi:hypothetical protein